MVWKPTFVEERRAMKITEVRVFVTCPGRNYTLVKVMTDEPGLYGVGEGTLSGSESIVAAYRAAVDWA
jgi:mannonate dehydratase